MVGDGSTLVGVFKAPPQGPRRHPHRKGTEMDEFERELEKPPAQRWEHDPNPLIGKLITRYTFEGEFAPAEMLEILPDGSDVAYSVLCGKATLRTFVKRRDPHVGDVVGIKFAGTQVSKSNGKEYALYNAACKPGPLSGQLIPGRQLEPDLGDGGLGEVNNP
jgi:hypothetical protein